MVYLLTGQKGSGKTQKMIELANQKAKACDGNVVFIKNSHNCHDYSSRSHSHDSPLFRLFKTVNNTGRQHKGASKAEIGKLPHKSRAGRL